LKFLSQLVYQNSLERSWLIQIHIVVIFSSKAIGKSLATKNIWKRDTSEYAPRFIECPSNPPIVQSAAILSSNETLRLPTRRNNIIWALRDILGRSNISGFDTNQYIDHAIVIPDELPSIGIAVSGGGSRALMAGAGVLAAFDNRTTNTTAPGQLGGILQASIYLSALSRGSWLIGSLYMQNFPSIQDVVTGPPSGLGSLWQFENSILQGMDNIT
jgi:lysophospholipase